jgi:translation initiation factor eIF-2B subunit alpha
VGESFKFVRLFPLRQDDVPAQRSHALPDVPTAIASINPLLDYTPPKYITLLFTDLGVLTPSAVSDELIKLYC